MSDLTKRPDGSLEKTRSNLRTLIDRYIPRHTQEEVWEMQRRHEERVWDLLSTIHEYRERNQRMAEHMEGMEREYYSKVRIPVSLGNFRSTATCEPMEMVRTYSIRWELDRYDMHYRMSDWERHQLDSKDTPYLFEMVGRQFEKHVKRELLPKLKAEYLKLYEQFKP